MTDPLATSEAETEAVEAVEAVPIITPSQCRAARGLLDWTQGDLAEVTGLSRVTIRAFEKGGEMRDSNRKLLRLAFEQAGVELIPHEGVRRTSGTRS